VQFFFFDIFLIVELCSRCGRSSMFKFSILESRCHYWGPKAVAPSLRYYIHVSPWIITGKVTLCIRESSQAMYYYIQPGCRVANPIDLVIRSRHSIGRLHCMPKWRPWSSHTSGECFSTRLDRPCILSNPWTEVDNDSRLSKGVFSSMKKDEKCTIARFGFIWQIVSNHWLIRFKTFVSQSTTKLYN
jgi:hypothetical protein